MNENINEVIEETTLEEIEHCEGTVVETESEAKDIISTEAAIGLLGIAAVTALGVGIYKATEEKREARKAEREYLKKAREEYRAELNESKKDDAQKAKKPKLGQRINDKIMNGLRKTLDEHDKRNSEDSSDETTEE